MNDVIQVSAAQVNCKGRSWPRGRAIKVRIQTILRVNPCNNTTIRTFGTRKETAKYTKTVFRTLYSRPKSHTVIRNTNTVVDLCFCCYVSTLSLCNNAVAVVNLHENLRVVTLSFRNINRFGWNSAQLGWDRKAISIITLTTALKLHDIPDIQGTPKSNPRKNLWNCNKSFRQICITLQRRKIRATYFANFVAIFDCVQKL